MSKHTKGPWMVSDRYARTIKAGSASVASTCVGNKIKPDNPTLEEARSNARLIAAAPELLEALRIVCEYFEADYGRPNEYYVAAEAIAKAESK